MSLWTPSGEHPVGDERPGGGARPADTGGGAGDPGDDEAMLEDVAAFRQQLADAPADVIIANHCYGLFELAAVYLSNSPPTLEHARLAIDALGFLVDGLGERLGDPYASLRDALAQIRLAYVQIAAAEEQRGQTGTENGSEA